MLIKGNERRVVIIKGKKDSPYEMACIFMKEDNQKHSGDIVRDAEQIIHSAESERIGIARHKKRRLSGFWSFFIGFVSGVLVFGGIYVLFTFCC